MISLGETFILPDYLRKRLGNPIGELYTSDDNKSAEKKLIPFLKNFRNLIITVGDVVTDSLFKIGIFPDLAIIDKKTLRGYYNSDFLYERSYTTISNPPATITFEAWITIRNIVHSFKEKSNQTNQANLFHQTLENTLIIQVIGEEDLLVLPCILECPIGSLVLYGQPNQGIVVVTISNDLKISIKSLLEKFEKRTSVQS
ncbi:MAG: GTP-dependent dephospho-CoA kinase family protein [Candidatus Thorarchaeota archaeon]